ncbi:unnamed protein product [Nippostrongylus brasiliensis]|uniref:TCF7 n=1 Tax=Nippostrongylus brasiliensis TaxID=27835 RepID=A0A0N4YCB5_NIPBR|nr:hypothetical protein Q1695_012501 [Nippostrongylus brasiliensis]VDL77765.1 unnamed protein product [Nippostrongylus brasiliensis]
MLAVLERSIDPPSPQWHLSRCVCLLVLCHPTDGLLAEPTMDLYNVLLHHNTQTGSDPTELLESSGYAAPAPHYVTEFGMEYPLSSHINNNT